MAIRIVEIVLAPVLLLGLLVARLLREAGVHRTPVARSLYDRVGVLPVHDHYYQPLVRPKRHLRAPLGEPRALPGVDLRPEAQLRLLDDLAAYTDELVPFLREPSEGGVEPAILNPFYGPVDAELLYAMVRWQRPRTIVEVGSGYSTRLVGAALSRNGDDARHVCIEPYENAWLDRLGVDVVRERVEDVDPSLFETLGAGDILFIDSSHVIRPQGDVVTLYLDVLPRLAPGVLVHVHDVLTPFDYPPEWVVEERRLWDEQYLVEALLSGGDRYRVVLAATYLCRRERDRLAQVCPSLRDPAATFTPVAFWIEVAAAA